MNRILLHIALLVTIAAGQEFRKTATSGFVFLEIPVSARTAALSEATVALSDMGAAGLFLNPASIGFMTAAHSYTVSYADWFAETKHYGAAYAVATAAGNFGFHAVMLDYGTFPLTYKISGSRSFLAAGTFTANATAMGITYSTALTDRFSFGVGLKYVNEKIHEYGASNILFDGGIIYYTGFESLRLGASMSNFGTDAKFINDPFHMPTMLRIGVASEVVGTMDSDLRITVMGEALHPSDAPERVNVGAEIGWMKMVSLRGGYKFFYDEESFNAGIGINGGAVVPVEVDFSLSSYGRLGTIVRFSVSGGL